MRMEPHLPRRSSVGLGCGKSRGKDSCVILEDPMQRIRFVPEDCLSYNWESHGCNVGKIAEDHTSYSCRLELDQDRGQDRGNTDRICRVQNSMAYARSCA